MERIEYRDSVDKSAYKTRGEWDHEPDKIQWKDETTGLPCLIVRGASGALCGYVGVAPDHPLFGKDYGADVNVHGGLTYAAPCAEGAPEARGICHIPGKGEPDHVWWFGFDCAHAGDFCPKHDPAEGPLSIGSPTGWGENVTYRNIQYVTDQVKDLAAQLGDHGRQVK
jgi:hypothetical protein